MSKTIYLDAPWVGQLEKDYIGRAIDSTYVSTIGPYVPEFEIEFSKFLSAKQAVATQSGTAAIHISLVELGIGPGDEVIVPSLTFAATINPVLYIGATPVIVDVDPDTWTMSTDLFEASITKRTKAVIPVHLYGNPCRMDAIMKIAAKHSIKVIEDATESLGAKYDGIATGIIGDFGCHSFNGNKTITTGGGGMLTGENMKDLTHIKFLVNQAREEERGYYHPEVGYNYRMTNIEAALGLAQMQRLPDILRKKNEIFDVYSLAFSPLSQIKMQTPCQKAVHSHWMNSVVLDKCIEVEKLQLVLRDKGIQSRRFFMPLDTLPPYKSFAVEKCKNAQMLYDHGLCLPSSVINDTADIEQVAAFFVKEVSK